MKNKIKGTIYLFTLILGSYIRKIPNVLGKKIKKSSCFCNPNGLVLRYNH